jgi:LysM repeat protein
MVKYPSYFLFVTLLLLVAPSAQAQVAPTGPVTAEDKRLYIERYKPLAIKEMQRTGIPASIKMAQALLESNAGKSQLALFANNHFGIKCGSTWNGRTIYFKDDDLDPLTGLLKESCFRMFDTPEASFMEHSSFLQKERYKFLFQLDPSDYRAWANGLRNAGYASDVNYPAKLIKIIEDNGLFQIQPDGSERPNATPQPPLANNNDKKNDNNNNNSDNGEMVAALDGVFYNNGVKAMVAKAGETPKGIAKKSEVPIQDILKYNELLKEGAVFKGGELVYIQRKKRGFWGWLSQTHKVENGETMYGIAQKYGVRLDALYERNHLPDGFEPMVGEEIYLRFGRSDSNVPKIRVQASKMKQPTAPPSNPAPTTMPDRPMSSNNPRNNPNNNGGNNGANTGVATPVKRNGEELDMEISPNKVVTDADRRKQAAEMNEGFQQPAISNENTTANSNNTYDPNLNTAPSKSNPTTNNDDWFAQGNTPSQPSNSNNNNNNNGNNGGGNSTYPTYTQPTPQPQPSAPVINNPNAPIYYTVKVGETMYAIARKYGVTPNYLQQLNNLSNNDLRVGQQLRVK